MIPYAWLSTFKAVFEGAKSARRVGNLRVSSESNLFYCSGCFKYRYWFQFFPSLASLLQPKDSLYLLSYLLISCKLKLSIIIFYIPLYIPTWILSQVFLFFLGLGRMNEDCGAMLESYFESSHSLILGCVVVLHKASFWQN